MAQHPERKEQEPDPHDDREIEVRGLVRLGAILVVVTIGAMGITWVLTASMVREERATHRAPPPIARARSETPAEPRLQPRPSEGLAALRAEEERALGTYRWIDPAAGVVGIPIERAIERMVEQPPPSRAHSDAPEQPSSSRPTQSTLGHRGDAR